MDYPHVEAISQSGGLMILRRASSLLVILNLFNFESSIKLKLFYLRFIIVILFRFYY